MTAAPDLRIAADRAALAAALAGDVAAALARRIRSGGKAVLAVSGGRTPVAFLEALSAVRLPWRDVIVTLVDERWVPEDHPRSNAALVRAHLLRGSAAAADFRPLYRPLPRPEDGLDSVRAELADLPQPFAAIVLGMGDDGHTASFFPGGDRLAEALDPAGQALVEVMHAPGAGEARLTLTLPPILSADLVALHIEGEGKRKVLQDALAGSDAATMPVRAVLAARPVTIHWAP